MGDRLRLRTEEMATTSTAVTVPPQAQEVSNKEPYQAVGNVIYTYDTYLRTQTCYIVTLAKQSVYFIHRILSREIHHGGYTLLESSNKRFKNRKLIFTYDDMSIFDEKRWFAQRHKCAGPDAGGSWSRVHHDAGGLGRECDQGGEPGR